MASIDMTQAVGASDAPPDIALVTYTHPDEVGADPELTRRQKRAILAAWASDERTVVGDPTLRQLPSGAIVRLYDIQRTLLALDRIEHPEPGHRLADRYAPRNRRWIARWMARRRRPWDDDDPPPAPAAARKPFALAASG